MKFLSKIAMLLGLLFVSSSAFAALPAVYIQCPQTINCNYSTRSCDSNSKGWVANFSTVQPFKGTQRFVFNDAIAQNFGGSPKGTFRRIGCGYYSHVGPANLTIFYKESGVFKITEFGDWGIGPAKELAICRSGSPGFCQFVPVF